MNHRIKMKVVWKTYHQKTEFFQPMMQITISLLKSINTKAKVFPRFKISKLTKQSFN